MNTLAEQLIAAYRQEQELYERVLQLVERQDQIMSEEPSPRRVLELCQEVEGLMSRIEAIEHNMGPAKSEWEKTRDDPDGTLDALLAAIEQTIESIGEQQQRVQRRLVAYVERERRTTDEARAAIRSNRAGRLYRAG